MATSKPLFQDLDKQIDLDDLETSEIESLCMNCHENGTTRILLTMIPMFREVIVSSFSCPHCGESNTQIQPGAPVQDRGVRFTLKVGDTECLSRMVVKSESAVVQLPELEFEIPAQRGQITTVESIIQQVVTNLELDQPYRLETQPQVGKQIEAILSKLRDYLTVKQPFTMVLDDPAGNSFLQGLFGEEDSALTVEHYQRSPEQDKKLHLGSEVTDTTGNSAQGATATSDDEVDPVGVDEVVSFPTNCSDCQSPAETRMKLIDIPHFKQVVIMATVCGVCGHRSNEVKSGTGVSDLGSKITLKLTDTSDLSRDILKAATAKLLIPELDFEVQSGSLGGRFTTVEGLLLQVRDQLKDTHQLLMGDSASTQQKSKLTTFTNQLDKIIDGDRLDVHLVLDDPTGNSYIQNLYAPDPDPCLTVENYERNFEQKEELGLNDMKTENYTPEDES